MRTHINGYFLLSLAVMGMTFAACNGSSPSSSSASGMLNLAVTDTPVDGATSVVVGFTGVEVQPAGNDNGNHGDMNGGDESSGDIHGAPSAGTITGTPSDDADPGDTDEGGDDQDAPPSAGTSSAPPAASNAGDDDSDDMGGNASKALTFTFPTPHQVDLIQQQGGSSAVLLSGVSLPAGKYAWIRLMVDPSASTITLADGSVHPLTIPSGAETGLKLVHGFTDRKSVV